MFKLYVDVCLGDEEESNPNHWPQRRRGNENAEKAIPDFLCASASLR